MCRSWPRWPSWATLSLVPVLVFSPAIAGFSVDQPPNEFPLDPGDVFLPGTSCEVDDGDGSCPVLPSLRVPNPVGFDLDAFAVEAPADVCPDNPPFLPGILFSFDDDDGPQNGPPDNATEIFFFDRCGVLGGGSYYTTITESALGLGFNPPPIDFDDDVDAYETRDALAFWLNNFNLIFSAEMSPLGGGLSPSTIYWVNQFTGPPGIWGTASDLGVPDTDNCDIDGIAPFTDPSLPMVILFTTDRDAPCGLDPGDIYASDNFGNIALYADDVIDLKIAFSEDDPVDIDALAVNTGGQFDVTDPFDPPLPPCEQSPFDQCPGTCPPDEICVPDYDLQECICERLPCEQSGFDECTGECPPDEVCLPDYDMGTCYCEQLPCEQSQFDECSGPCASGEICVPDYDIDACVCVAPPCEQSIFPQCDGPCPPDEICVPVSSQDECVCRPEDFYKADWPNYAPSGMPDFSQDQVDPYSGSLWPPTYCGPAALWNSMWWFDSEMECDLDRRKGDASETEPNDSCDLADPLGERPPIPGSFAVAGDTDWYVFEIPGPRHRACEVTISTCALRSPGDADTTLTLYDNCNAAGVPGNVIAFDDDGVCPPNLQSEITEELGPGRYWVKVEHSALSGSYTLSLGIDCYPMVERSPDAYDDHAEENTGFWIPGMAVCMNTDDITNLGTNHKGTLLPDMEACIDTWLDVQDLDEHFYQQTQYLPSFEEVEAEIERSEDVLLLLGFYWQEAQDLWLRCGGHYVTAAGVNSDNLTIALSDPAFNNAETGGDGRVRGPKHDDHAPALLPPPDHNDAQNVSHDRYAIGPPVALSTGSQWSIPTYGTPGFPTRCEDVARWCLPPDYGQNPIDPAQDQWVCPDPDIPISVEVEAMLHVSPYQTPICILLDNTAAWPENVRLDRTHCSIPGITADAYEVIRGKLCNLRDFPLAAHIDLGQVQCLYDDVTQDRFEDRSPDQTGCFGGWFYLVRRTGDTDYGTGHGAMPRFPFAGGCP